MSSFDLRLWFKRKLVADGITEGKIWEIFDFLERLIGEDLQ